MTISAIIYCSLLGFSLLILAVSSIQLARYRMSEDSWARWSFIAVGLLLVGLIYGFCAGILIQ